MKYIRGYKEFEPLNEELTRTQRVWLNLPTILAGFIGKLVGIHPLLNLRWREIKRKTVDSNFDPIVAHSSQAPNTMKDELTELKMSDLKASKIKIPMLLRGWKIYLSDRKLQHEKNRGIVYITKDTIKKGDRYTGERLSERDVYPESAFNYTVNQHINKGKKRDFKIKDEFPAIIMIAKFEKEEESDTISQYIDDICLDMEDEFPVSAEPSGNSQSDKFWVRIKVLEDKTLIFDEKLDSKIKEISERTVQYLKSEGKKGYKYRISYKIKGPLYYTGEMGKFKSLIEPAEKYSRDHDYYNQDGPYFYKDKRGMFNISKLSEIGYTYIKSQRVDMGLDGDDIKTLLSDIDNCSSGTITTSIPGRNKVDKIEIKSVSIDFEKA